MPVSRRATTGKPAARASSAAIPKDSSTLTSTNASAREKRSRMAGRGRYPVNSTVEAIPRRRASVSIRRRSGPSPITIRLTRRIPSSRFAAAAKKLSAARQKSAEKLNKAVNSELAPLKLERAKFMTQVETDEAAPGPQGFDRVEFWVQTNPGTKPGPMMKVASGGELSRFLLALKVVLSDRGSAPTLVFDEIDTGVGGAVADAIGARLARLAGKVQVMAVTHAPQVAARADQYLLIFKDTLDKGKRVATRVNALAPDHRREEIARMLAGAEITAEARAAADRLLKAAS